MKDALTRPKFTRAAALLTSLAPLADYRLVPHAFLFCALMFAPMGQPFVAWCCVVFAFLFRYDAGRCRHRRATFVRNIYGDEINATGARSWWECDGCGEFFTRDVLVATECEMKAVGATAEESEAKTASLAEYVRMDASGKMSFLRGGGRIID
jgi:hypothetical protein